MKGTIKAIALATGIATLAGCSGMTEIAVRETKAHPNWYVDCEQIGSEGFIFFNRKDYAYACGMGESRFEQASEAQAYAFAVKAFAERINGEVNSSTTIDIVGNNANENRTTRTFVEHAVRNTAIREHLEVKRHAYELQATGRVHTYVRIKMPLEVFNQLLEEARNAKVSTIAQSSN
jgi:hypothetical protein